jgi:hypothetical protein
MYTELRYWPWLSTPILALLALVWQPWLAIVCRSVVHRRLERRASVAPLGCCGTIRSPGICASCSNTSDRKSVSTSSKMTKPSIPSHVTSAPWSTPCAKGQNDKRGFGTLKNMYAQDAEWLLHSNRPRHVDPQSLRITIGGPQCRHPVLRLDLQHLGHRVSAHCPLTPSAH